MKNSEKIFNKGFSVRLLHALDKNGMSQRDLAIMIGVSPVSITNYVSGFTVPKVFVLKQMAEALNCDPSWLAGFKEDEERDQEIIE